LDAPILSPEQDAEAEHLFQALRPILEAELRQMTRLLASKPDDKLLGKTELEVRDLVHRIGAKAIATALNERKEGGGTQPRITVPGMRRALQQLLRPMAQPDCRDCNPHIHALDQRSQILTE
jgi:hypothetical protein